MTQEIEGTEDIVGARTVIHQKESTTANNSELINLLVYFLCVSISRIHIVLCADFHESTLLAKGFAPLKQDYMQSILLMKFLIVGGYG